MVGTLPRAPVVMLPRLAIGFVLALTEALSAACGQSILTSNTATQAAVAVTAVTLPHVQMDDVQVGQTDSTVTLENTGQTPVSLSGWSLGVGSSSVALPTSVTLQPRAKVTIHTAAGAGTSSDVYLDQNTQSLVESLPPGAHLALIDPSGVVVTAYSLPD